MMVLNGDDIKYIQNIAFQPKQTRMKIVFKEIM